MGPGPLIAIDVILLYTILGPLVLFAVYVLFDFLSLWDRNHAKKSTFQKDPALWTRTDINNHLNRI